jgi:hypothetical protein
MKIGRFNQHESTNENDLQLLIDFAAGRQIPCSNKSTTKPGTLQTSALANRTRGANIDLDDMFCGHKLRYRINRASNTTPQQWRHFLVERLEDGIVGIVYRYELEVELSVASDTEPLSLDE